jgi:hypothetical protein
LYLFDDPLPVISWHIMCLIPQMGIDVVGQNGVPALGTHDQPLLREMHKRLHGITIN